MFRTLLVFGLLLLISTTGYSQEKYKVVVIGFYNVENFFDPEDDPNKKDEDFTPNGIHHYTEEVYKQKLHNIATVIEKMGTDVTPDGPAIIGFAELENDKVLKRLVAEPEIAKRGYKYEWFYTPDERGISTAMLYNPRYFTVLSSRPLHVPVETIGWDRPTRDVLYVCGILAGDTVHVLVNHWPSKLGGEAATTSGRKLAASVNKKIVDSLVGINPNTKVLIMGDLNDNPTCDAVMKVLNAKSDKASVAIADIYNPWINLYKKGLGTEIYRGEWNLIDQVMLSGAFLKNNNHKWGFYNVEIFNKEFLINKIGEEKGTPHRSYAQNHSWDNGYSDHFPVLTYLVEKTGQ